MSQRAEPPGPYSPAESRLGVGSVEQVAPSAPDEDLDWRQYLDVPKPDRLIGIACSGGGIRSAAYCLGGLQELRRNGWLEAADHLSCVSGGGYMAIAHEVLVSETIAADPDWSASRAGPFTKVPPYEVDSPEERHLRSRLDYLAPGGSGRIWLLINLIGGMVRHLLPFAMVVYMTAWVTGMSLTRWVGPSIGACRDFAMSCPGRLKLPPLPEQQQVSLLPFLCITGVMVLSVSLFLVARQGVQSRERPSDDALAVLQGWALRWSTATALFAFFTVVVPAGLILLHTRPFGATAIQRLITGLGAEGGLLGLVFGAVRRMRLGLSKRLAPIVTMLATPVLIVLPYLGLTYWVAHGGPHWRLGQTVALGVAIGLYVVFGFSNEVTSLPHLFYRERLATAFIGRRTKGPFQTVGYDQPPWSRAISFSSLQRSGFGPGAMPNLVVCATVDLSDVVPPGRGGASFTFEQDFSGGPSTGYVRTSSLESRTKSGTVTMPALMAISGAAVAPSMGKMTRSGLRFAMALFDLRLGVWLPNPRRKGWQNFTPLDVWADRNTPPGVAADSAQIEAAAQTKDSLFARPGTKYVFYEALGKNSLSDKHVYVSDGGHWDNLGLVELLRRGCTKIISLDAAGDDIHHFNTLSEAIDLAHADLGVEFDLDMTDLTPVSRKEPCRPDEDCGFDDRSPMCSVLGTFKYPNGVIGRLLYVKAAMCDNAPVEVLSYRERDHKFPNHPTTDQFFNELTFESYRTLGEHAVREAFDAKGAL